MRYIPTVKIIVAMIDVFQSMFMSYTTTSVRNFTLDTSYTCMRKFKRRQPALLIMKVTFNNSSTSSVKVDEDMVN